MKNKKKTILICIIIIIIIILSFSFTYNEKQFQKSNLLIEKTEIEINVLENTITNEGLSFCIKNNSDKTIYLSEDIFSLEFQKNEIWYEQPALVTEFTSTATEYEVDSSKEITIDINWNYFYGQVGSGKYRLVIPINNNEKSTFITTEFTIKEENNER